MKKKTCKILAYAAMLLFALIQIFPFLWLVNFSLKGTAQIFTESSLSLPNPVIWNNYQEAWFKGNVAKYFMNSVLVSAVSVGGILLIAGMMAYAITRLTWKWKKGTFNLLMLGMMIPIHATLIPLFIVLKKMHLLSTHMGIILPYIATGLPLAVFIYSNFIRSIPFEMESAAAIDGCSVTKMYFKIILPILKPATATIAIFSFMSIWNEFIMASTFLQNQSLNTLPVGLMAFKGQYLTDWGPLGAAIVIASIPILLFYFIFSEQVEKSFAAGAALK
ncbi:carbohydrate ABC transporter permease [Muricomes sp. OA1]|uniref:Carbohydrate ABC transporter permease n=1 Tax=Hungatella hathewayi TaxID=154046 RepID=A0A3E2WUZ1_9FIRM|nr:MULTISPECIES: carbohydrate ABC transporter permease [Clostridia]MCH1972190.1 carbohydrate ABC transporter permease [Muricomes sp. OA1]RGC31229.1 carbohydrate ABC transporter permease [Hungatella hathewayi]GKH31009.1 sugar ABC transporter permease [Faecalicatena contorta]